MWFQYNVTLKYFMNLLFVIRRRLHIEDACIISRKFDLSPPCPKIYIQPQISLYVRAHYKIFEKLEVFLQENFGCLHLKTLLLSEKCPQWTSSSLFIKDVLYNVSLLF